MVFVIFGAALVWPLIWLLMQFSSLLDMSLMLALIVGFAADAKTKSGFGAVLICLWWYGRIGVLGDWGEASKAPMVSL